MATLKYRYLVVATQELPHVLLALDACEHGVEMLCMYDKVHELKPFRVLS